MKSAIIFFSIFSIVVSANTGYGQDLSAQWRVASFTEPCTEVNGYRNVYPGPVSFDSAGNLLWLMRDRSTCRSPYNNFTALKVTPEGSPMLADFKKYTVPGLGGYGYYEQIAAYGNRGYWVGTVYERDTKDTTKYFYLLSIAAIDLESGATLWTKNWSPAGPSTASYAYQPVAIAATADGIYITANTTISVTEPVSYSAYVLIVGKFDPAGKELWSKLYSQPFYQYFRGNIIVTDSLLYTCAYRYSDAIPYYRGMGFIGAYDTHTGVLTDSFYFSKKRPQSEFDPSFLATDGKQILACGTNTAPIDAAIFNASFSPHLDSITFSSYPTSPTYSYITGAAMNENGILFTATMEYASSAYRTVLNMFDCRDRSINVMHSGLLLDPLPGSVGSMMASGNSLYISMTATSPDTTINALNRTDAYLAKFDAAPLAVNTHDDITSSHIGIYPNPAVGNAVIRFTNELEDGRLEIFDALGRNVRTYSSLHGTELLFYRGSLAPGIYVCRISGNGIAMASAKMILQ
ncbi:MAG: T9SS type A sorting domain-containing protein [Bacteroidota bacterium]|nr:T9SS type A sorting domain-containing protein [Bacteroidota bacterium]